MKRGLTILTAALFAGALALPAMAQSTDNGANKEVPAAGAMANPNTTGSESAAMPSSGDSTAKTGSEAMKPEQQPAGDTAAQQKKGEEKSDTNTTSDAGSNPSGNSATGHNVE
jgi:hypothetical protein